MVIYNRNRQRYLLRKVWRSMISRCNNVNDTAYKNYGGRGIKVCERWMNFGFFFEDMGYPASGMTLDRRDNDKGYSPDNCRWVSRAKQNKNQRKIKSNSNLITFEGITMSVLAWAKFLGLTRQNVFQKRINYGWSIVKAATTPLTRIHK